MRQLGNALCEMPLNGLKSNEKFDVDRVPDDRAVRDGHGLGPSMGWVGLSGCNFDDVPKNNNS